MEIRVKKYDHVSTQLPRVHQPEAVARRREAEARMERDPEKREALLKSADEWRRSKPVWHKTDRNGKPVFTSRRDVEEFQSKTGFKWD